jgi:uncharacterized protein YndB with AHSA1/START domain
MTETITKTIVIDALPDVVFRALKDEQELTQWFPNQAILQARWWQNGISVPTT